MPRGSRLWGCLLLGAFAWATAAPPAPPPPQPPPPQLPASALVAPAGACEKLGPCDLYSQLQEHSRRIAGFSYNVKKADAALTALARQQAAAAVRTDRLAHALSQLEMSLDGLSNAPAAATGETALGAPSSPAATTPTPVTVTDTSVAAPAPAPAGDWEQAAARELARLGDRLTRLREQVNATFVRTLRENSEELATMRGRVASLNAQVADLAAAARGETAGRRVVAQGESRTLTAASNSAPTPSPATTTAATATSTSTEPHTAVQEASPPMAQRTPTLNVSNGGDTISQEVVPTVASELGTTTAAPLVTNTSSADSSSGPGSDSEQTCGRSGTNETSTVHPPIGVTSNQGEGEVSEPVNGNGNGNGNGESVDSLGIELETVRTAFDTLHAQVTDLQARCNSRGDELEAMVATLERRLAGLETSRTSPPESSVTSPDLNTPFNSSASANAANNNNNSSNADGMLDGGTNATNIPQRPEQLQTSEGNANEVVHSEVKLQTPQISIHIEGLTEIIKEDNSSVRVDATTSSTVAPTSEPSVSPESKNRK